MIDTRPLCAQFLHFSSQFSHDDSMQIGIHCVSRRFGHKAREIRNQIRWIFCLFPIYFCICFLCFWFFWQGTSAWRWREAPTAAWPPSSVGTSPSWQAPPSSRWSPPPPPEPQPLGFFHLYQESSRARCVGTLGVHASTAAGFSLPSQCKD